MTVIGITGGTGGGKTSALRALAGLGAMIIDCDETYHKLLNESEAMLRELETSFPGAFPDGVFERKALGRIVFSNESALLALNAITHKYVKQQIERYLCLWREKGVELAAIDAIALIESGISDMCDIVVGVTAPVDIRIRRVAERDGISIEYAKLRVEAQKQDDYFSQHCDYILESKYDSVLEFEKKCREFFIEILEGKV